MYFYVLYADQDEIMGWVADLKLTQLIIHNVHD